MATITKRKHKNGDVYYTVRIRVQGYKPLTATFKKLTDAREWISDNETPRKTGQIHKRGRNS